MCKSLLVTSAPVKVFYNTYIDNVSRQKYLKRTIYLRQELLDILCIKTTYLEKNIQNDNLPEATKIPRSYKKMSYSIFHLRQRRLAPLHEQIKGNLFSIGLQLLNMYAA